MGICGCVRFWLLVGLFVHYSSSAFHGHKLELQSLESLSLTTLTHQSHHPLITPCSPFRPSLFRSPRNATNHNPSSSSLPICRSARPTTNVRLTGQQETPLNWPSSSDILLLLRALQGSLTCVRDRCKFCTIPTEHHALQPRQADDRPNASL